MLLVMFITFYYVEFCQVYLSFSIRNASVSNFSVCSVGGVKNAKYEISKSTIYFPIVKYVLITKI